MSQSQLLGHSRHFGTTCEDTDKHLCNSYRSVATSGPLQHEFMQSCVDDVLQVPPQLIASMVFSKQLLHPLLGLLLLLGARQSGLLPLADTSALEQLVMLVVYATPTAVLVHSLATLLQVRGEGQGKRGGMGVGKWRDGGEGWEGDVKVMLHPLLCWCIHWQPC